ELQLARLHIGRSGVVVARVRQDQFALAAVNQVGEAGQLRTDGDRAGRTATAPGADVQRRAGIAGGDAAAGDGDVAARADLRGERAVGDGQRSTERYGDRIPRVDSQ